MKKLEQTNIKNQLNVQINDSSGSNYAALLDKLIGGSSNEVGGNNSKVDSILSKESGAH